MSGESFKYNYLMYNKFFSLRLSLLMKLILAFLCKDFFLVAVVGASALKGGGVGTSEVMALIHPVFFLADFPAITLAYAAIVRRPESKILPRMIWKKGRELILLSTTIYTTLVIFRRDWDLLGLSWADWIAVSINILIIFYIMKSEYVSDLFNDFPIAKPTGA